MDRGRRVARLPVRTMHWCDWMSPIWHSSAVGYLTKRAEDADQTPNSIADNHLGRSALTALGADMVSRRLGNPSTFTGLILLLATASLYLLERKQNIRRQWGPVASWLQVHMYVGTFACCVGWMHVQWPIRGPFEQCLAACYACVALSGLGLAVLSRWTPRRLASIALDYPLEQIPALQLAVAEDAHRVAIASSQTGEGATLAEYYRLRLLPFFRMPRGWLYRLLPTGSKRRQLLRELEALDRYLATAGIDRRRQLSLMVQSKDDLDYHAALQRRLRLLLAIHVALTWSLAIMIVVHVVLVMRFSGALL